MQRRDFLKISTVTGATAALDACGRPDVELIRFIPEEELTPGVAVWKPSICTACSAGCGVMVRVMEGDAEVIRNGQLGLIKMGLAKKLEGNPNHPVNRGKLCPRGQASIQMTYHPDRIRHPLKRTGPRGAGEFEEVSWEDAINELAGQLSGLRAAKEGGRLVFLSKPLHGQRKELVERFLAAFGAAPPVYFEAFDDAVVRRANALSFGRPQLPTFDLANSNYIVAFGADFLGTWNSPVAQSIAYGQFRQGRPGRRGKFVMLEQRLSQTGANADEWIYTKPGAEGLLALGLAHVMLREKLRRTEEAGRAGELISGWRQGLPDYDPAEVEKRTGVPAARIERLAREMAAHPPAVAIVGGAPLAHTNALGTALAVNALNGLLGSVEKPGGVFFTAPALPATPYFPETPSPPGNIEAIHRLIQPLAHGTEDAAKILLVHGANPVFALPANYHVREALDRTPFIASFGSFIDETSALADLILPDHAPLESWLDDIPESGSLEAVVSLAPPAMRPLHNTRAMSDVLLDVARRLDEDIKKQFQWDTFEEMLRAVSQRLSTHLGSIESKSAEEFWVKAQGQGGWWGNEVSNPSTRKFLTAPRTNARLDDPEFDGAEEEFPFHILPFESGAFGDGSLAHLPWLQEMPDALSTAMWSTWVEINPQTAARLGIEQSDLIEVASQHGKLEAPALVSPGIAPDVVAMPVGQGHANFTRYASGRGANPFSILAPLVVAETGSLAWAATRVKIRTLGKSKELILFAGGMHEHPHFHR
jgi:anaerobic selenocysteine-containing dehydrogenase